ncbi:uncharacterized protein LOC110813118 [Carica papaya]|uniref:uncharacterized protein LOC110813118 n=1 Tax=Carica papaya TaxID=3649 RepID=UPI000B8CB879|nr:uncharacterized protein LOC110813118 [Carica papaya]
MKSSVFFLFVIITAISYSVRLGDAVAEPPEYTLLQSEPDFEVRLYKESWWMTALVQGTSFEKSTKDGFHSGTNYTIYLQVVSIYPWRQPQLYWTSNDSSSVKQSSHWFEYLVRYYVPAKYGNVPPQPSPELNLQLRHGRNSVWQ